MKLPILSMTKRGRQLRALERENTELARKYPRYDWQLFRAITLYFFRGSLSTLAEQAFLYRLACDLPPNSLAVEVGSFLGHSTCLIAAGLRGERAHVYAVDAFTCKGSSAEEHSLYLDQVAGTVQKDQLRAFRSNVARLRFEKKITPIVSETASAAEKLQVTSSFFDFLFIDADHTFAACKADIETFLPLVKPGGAVVFHDFCSTCGVPKAVFEAIRAGHFREFIGVVNTTIAFQKS
jgi:predicted O-methyltransferase YrrM